MRVAVLTDEQVVRLHEASLWIIQEIGVDLPHPEARRLFAEAGAQVDETSERVKIPESLVAKSLETAVKVFSIYGRDRSKRAEFGVGKRNYNGVAGEALWIDDTTGERRYSTLADAARAARLSDGLPHLTIPGAMADPHEFPPTYGAAAALAEVLRNTTKPIAIWFHNRTVSRLMNEIMIAVAGSEEEAKKYPLSYPLFEPISPLRFPFDAVDALFENARLNLPVHVGPLAQTGMSAPGTLAATMIQNNAEFLAGLCVTQLIKPGTPICYGGIPHAFDMRITQPIFSGPEQGLMAVAMTQVGKHYGFPVYINVGATDSKVPDAQAGMEAAATLTLGVLAGADIFCHFGICGMDQGASLDLLVMQHELISYTERVMQGIRFEEDLFGLEVIKEVGPGGTFMDHDFTAKHFRQEIWFPRLLDRQMYDAWVTSGKQTMADRCRAEKERILREHQPEPLPEDVDREIERILAAARRDLGIE